MWVWVVFFFGFLGVVMCLWKMLLIVYRNVDSVLFELVGVMMSVCLFVEIVF